MSDFAVEVKYLSKEFAVPMTRKKFLAVNDISFNIKKGEIYGLIGPNGSGKSTTMKIILGLIKPTTGHTKIFGKSSYTVASRNNVGFLPENPYFYKYLNGLETMKFYGKLCNIGGKNLDKIANQLLEQVGLADAKNRRVGSYSKGMLQRIGLAQALVQDPKLIFLDEPTAGVDPRGSRELRDLLLELKKRNVSIFLSSHLLEQVQDVCDEIGVMSHGNLVVNGNLNDLISIENQTEIIVENASDGQIEQVREIFSQKKSKLIRCARPKTTLEKIFLQATKEK